MTHVVGFARAFWRIGLARLAERCAAGFGLSGWGRSFRSRQFRAWRFRARGFGALDSVKRVKLGHAQRGLRLGLAAGPFGVRRRRGGRIPPFANFQIAVG